MPETKAIDLLIHASWVLPIAPDNTILTDHAVAIHDGIIVDLLPSIEAGAHYSSSQTFELKEQVLMPGLVNAHGHSAMSLLRGYADDHPLMEWLEQYIWPAENQWVDAEFVTTGTEIAIAEMLKTGTTCFSDMYFFPGQVASSAHQLGVRAQICSPLFDFPSPWGQGPDDYLHKGLQLIDDYKHSQFIDIALGPHAPYTTSDSLLSKVASYAHELDVAIQMHVHETATEIEQSRQTHQKRPLQRLADLGLLGPRFQAVHMTQVNTDDIALLQQHACHVIHCPRSNLKLASGFCPAWDLQQAGINIALGTDGAASNNSLDMFAELNMAALLAKGVSKDSRAFNALQTLAMASLQGAKALGLEEHIGSLEIGKAADLISLKLDQLPQQPLYQPDAQLVYTQAGQAVCNVWINGQQQLQNGQLQRLSEPELKDKARYWQKKIAAI